MIERRIRLTGSEEHVAVTATGDETVSVQLGGGSSGVTIVGRRYDVHRLILEADRQLSRLDSRWA